MSNMVNLIVLACPDYNQDHTILFANKLIDNAQSSPAQLDF